MFRQEAIDNQKWKSNAVIVSTIPAWIIFLLSFFITLVFVLYITLGSYTRREEIMGEVVMQPHPIVLSATKAGYISEKYVSVNQLVKKGDPLFKITLERVTDSGNINLNSIQSLSAQIAKTQEIIETLEKNKQDTVDNLTQQIDNNRRIYQETKAYLAEIVKSVAEHTAFLKKYQALLKQGLVNNEDVAAQRSRYFQQKSLENSLQAQVIQQESIILNLENEVEMRKTDFNNQILRHEIQKSDLSIRLMELESISELIISSPVDGVVESISVTVGQTVKEGDAVSQVIPANKGKYQLVMWLPNSAISFVKPQDKVNIRYEAFPFEKFGQFLGVIEHIATVPASLQELAFYKNLPTNADPNNPLYKIVVSIDDQQIDYNGTKLAFLSGMKAEATVFLETRKLYEWMLFPVYHLMKNKEQE